MKLAPRISEKKTQKYINLSRNLMWAPCYLWMTILCGQIQTVIILPIVTFNIDKRNIQNSNKLNYAIVASKGLGVPTPYAVSVMIICKISVQIINTLTTKP